MDTVGAGDAFDAAFLSFFLRDGEIGAALLRATFAGAVVTTVRGDYEAFPKEEDIEKWLKNTEEFDFR